ncbi:flavonol 3-O-glucosyltransferase UGT89B1-like [Diospyros lotus]|uniref:flavonol 3-O-glucosyltransferase UGT89B1-like n=1 Tax=Diospyros lotus TaxID=55363 RepID=UPI0022565477|nr:flavonol 3-O-glucosyltransferase UGT89B1-like [Diospyros lotus]
MFGTRTGCAHVLLCPFPTSGHIIPMLDMASLLLSRGLKLTVLVTPTLLHLLDPVISRHASSGSVQPLVLPLPSVHRTSNLPWPLEDMYALCDLAGPITDWFRSHPSPPVAIISDFFLGWTHRLATDLGVPRLVLESSGAFGELIFTSMLRDLPKADDPHDDESFVHFPKLPNSPKCPWWQLPHLYRLLNVEDPDWEFFRNSWLCNSQSWGAIVNSFDELEGPSLNQMKKEMGHDRVWAVGPLLPSDGDRTAPSKRGGTSSVPVHELISWLDCKPDGSVVYVCFGSTWTLTDEQVGSLAGALDSSGVDFVWVVKKDDVVSIPDGFDERTKGRGFMINGWAPQVQILSHRAVGAFVTHCGWNSFLEGIAASVLMLSWPLGADQFTNTMMLVDQLGAGVKFCNLGNRAVPDSAELARLLAESVNEKGWAEERARVRKLRKSAVEAVKGGSSAKNLNALVKKLNELVA